MAAPALTTRLLPVRAPSRGGALSGARLALAATSATFALAVVTQLVWTFVEPNVADGVRWYVDVATALCIAVAAFLFAWYSRSDRMQAERGQLARLEEQARRDELSGLYNYRYLRERMAIEVDEANISGAPCAVVMLDLNNFKDVNDRFGHQAGDAIIGAIGAAMRAAVDNRGIAARYGGDEFTLLLPQTPRAEALNIAAEVAAALLRAAAAALPQNRHLPVSAEYGVAVYPEDGADPEALIACADRAMYDAKSRLTDVRARSDERHAQDVFFAIGEATSASLDAGQLVNNVVRAVATSLDLASCSIWQARGTERLGVPAYYTRERGLAQAFSKALAADPLRLEEVRARGLLASRTVYVDDAVDSEVWAERFRSLFEPGTWFLSVPLPEPMVGMMLLHGRHATCAPPTTSLAEAIGRLVAAAMRNADTFAHARRQAEQLSALAGVGGLLFGEGDFESRVSAVAARVADVMGIDMLTLDTFDPSDQKPFLRAFHGRGPDGKELDDRLRQLWLQLRPAITEPGVAEFLARATEPIIMDDPANQVPEMYRNVVLSSGTRYAVIMPIAWRQEINGLMYFASYRPNAFDGQDIALMRAVAAQLAPSFQVAKLHQQLEHSYADLKESHREAVLRLAYAAESRDPYTGRHLQRIGALSEAIARRIGFDETQVEAIGYAAIVHDLGKLRIPDEILIKPGELTEDDWKMMRKHPEFGGDLLGSGLFSGVPHEVALHHHERWDGSGYPFGLAGEDIPLTARVVAVADVYDALISARPYKHAWTRERALAELLRMRGQKLCPKSIDVFLQLWTEGEVARIERETDDASFEADFRDRLAA